MIRKAVEDANMDQSMDTEEKAAEAEKAEAELPAAELLATRAEEAESGTEPAEVAKDKALAAEAVAAEEGELKFPEASTENLFAGLDALMPAILFLIFNSRLGLGWAIGAATLWSLKVAVSRRRRRLPIGKFIPVVTAYIIARGVIGIVTDSAAVYFGIGIATKFGIAAAVAFMAWRGRNLLAMVVPYVFEFDKATRSHPVFKDALDKIAYAASIYYAISASFDIWLYNNNDVNGYVAIRLIVNWPAGLVVFWLCVWYLVRRLREVPEFPGLMKLFEARTDRIEKAWDEKRARRKARKRKQ